MTKTIINHKHQKSLFSSRASKKSCNAIVECIEVCHGIRVIFYGRYEWDASGKSHVWFPERDELHVFETQTDAYNFLCDLDWQLTEAELAAC